MSSHPDPVLVVGAGPVGLAAALSLAVHGVPVRIVERDTERTDLSKALVVWARTLEVLDGLLDADRLLEAGIAIDGAEFHGGGRLLGEVDLAHVPSRFGAGVFLPQCRTEGFLIERLTELGVTVERGVELSSFEDRGDRIMAVLRTAGDGEETVSAPWLIGCDGAHSDVRHRLGLAFEGGDEPTRFVLGDVHVEGAPPRDRLAVHLHSGGLLGFFPLPDGRFRVLGDTESSGTDDEPSLEELQALVDERMDGDARLSDPHWLGSFRVRERVLEDYRSGRCLLAGDAAHVHSPAGGQGMNTGIQDAVNLGWKLAMHERGLASEALLDSYSEERSMIGRQVVAATTRMTRVMTSRNPLLQSLRNGAIRVGTGVPAIRRLLAGFLSELRVGYRTTGIRGNDAVLRRHSDLHAGDRVPHLVDADGMSLDLESRLPADRFTLLVVEGADTPDFARAVEVMTEGVPGHLRPHVEVVPVTRSASGAPGALVDGEGLLHEAAGFLGHGAVLVRPDRYIALFLGSLEPEPMVEWFAGL